MFACMYIYIYSLLTYWNGCCCWLICAMRYACVCVCVFRGSRSSVKMQSAVTDEIVEKLKGITLLEASELVKQIEETFGVDASAPAGGMMVAAPGGAAGGAAVAEEVEEQTEFDVIISEIDSAKKIAAIKVVRQLTTLGLKEAKDAVTELPNTLLTGATKVRSFALRPIPPSFPSLFFEGSLSPSDSS